MRKTRIKLNCEECGNVITRKIRGKNDAGRFCGRECSTKFLSRQAQEKSRREAKELEDYRANKPKRDMIRREIIAIRRIKRNIDSATRTCEWCGRTFINLRKFNRKCSEQCRTDMVNHVSEQYKQSDSYKAIKRSAKSRRRAIMRGANGGDKIDPIKVFNKAGWKCYICGCDTPMELRGTINDNAPELEHMIALANGGTHTWDNVACACRKCNHEKGANDYDVCH